MGSYAFTSASDFFENLDGMEVTARVEAAKLHADKSGSVINRYQTKILSKVYYPRPCIACFSGLGLTHRLFIASEVAGWKYPLGKVYKDKRISLCPECFAKASKAVVTERELNRERFTALARVMSSGDHLEDVMVFCWHLREALGFDEWSQFGKFLAECIEASTGNAKVRFLFGFQELILQLDRERAEKAEVKESDPDVLFREWAADGKLGAMIRHALESGMVSWDEIDPAPPDVPDEGMYKPIRKMATRSVAGLNIDLVEEQATPVHERTDEQKRAFAKAGRDRRRKP